MLSKALDDYAIQNVGRYPATLDELVQKDEYGFSYVDQASIVVDPWGHPYRYEPPTSSPWRPHVYSLGADGLPGGTGDDQDVELDSAEPHR